MNRGELVQNLSYFIENIDAIGISIYVILRDGGDIKKLDVSSEALPNLKKIFMKSIEDDLVLPEELSVLPLSTSDDRINVVYEYDIDIPDELKKMDEITQTDDIEFFDVSNSEVSSVKALLIEIGDNDKQVVLYKTMAPINLYGRSSLFLIKSDQRFKQITEEFIRITPGFQVLRYENSLIVLDLKTIERMFGFHDAIKREALLGMKAITDSAILVNPDSLLELLDDVTFARKLVKVAKSSPVIRSGVANSIIVSFCKTFPTLKGKIRFNENEDKINLDTKISKNLFIQLLMDNYLTSELTKFNYASVAKDEVDESI
ncbi:MAG: DUF4868 domain-containing protein [Gammaproteobacteria bacterium]|nr:DUF4868 domain-containing protein [Gammaproteobacteria bacterium]MCF6261548.1 DUF4868 domain-containing protein [Gammaproteobacteria bacterium]